MGHNPLLPKSSSNLAIKSHKLTEMDTEDTLYCDIGLARQSSLLALESNAGLVHLAKEKRKVKKAFDLAFQYKLSTSLIVIGSNRAESFELVRAVLRGYANEIFHASSVGDRFAKSKNYAAVVNGSLHNNDQEALVDIANQFLVRRDGDSNGNLALEDLEDHFRQCRCDGIPAIIVIEDFHVFTKRKRQTLIYALLDLMHKKDLLFTVSDINK